MLSLLQSRSGHSPLAAIIGKFIVGFGTVLYPFAVYYGLAHRSTREVALVALTFFCLATIVRFRGDQNRSMGTHLTASVVVIGFATLALLLDDRRYILMFPVVISLMLLSVFVASLREGPTISERFARLQLGELGPEEIQYCRIVTIVWCGFFAFNAVVALMLSLLAPYGWWALYTGLISYVLIGLIFTVEFVVRVYRFPRARPFAIGRRAGFRVGSRAMSKESARERRLLRRDDKWR